jgi:Phosphomannomutase
MTLQTQKLFGTDGIRGVVGEFPLTEKYIKTIGDYSAVILKTIFNTQNVFIGWDTRESSPFIANLLTKSFLNYGYNVYLLGFFLQEDSISL